MSWGKVSQELNELMYLSFQYLMEWHKFVWLNVPVLHTTSLQMICGNLWLLKVADQSRWSWCLICTGRIQSKMLKEEIAQLVKFSSMSSLALLRSHIGTLFYQTTKANCSWFDFWYQGGKVNVQQLENQSCMFPSMKNASVYSPMVYMNLLKLLDATMRRQTRGFFCRQTTYACQLKTLSFTHGILMFFWLLSQHLVKFLVACLFALAPKTKHASYPSIKWSNRWFFVMIYKIWTSSCFWNHLQAWMHWQNVILQVRLAVKKVMSFKVILKNQRYIRRVCCIWRRSYSIWWMGTSFSLWHVYGHKCKYVNLVWYKLYSSRQGKLEAHSILPCLGNLHLHSRRATYQTFVWRNYLIAKPDISSTIGNGWELGENDLHQPLMKCWSWCFVHVPKNVSRANVLELIIVF